MSSQEPAHTPNLPWDFSGGTRKLSIRADDIQRWAQKDPCSTRQNESREEGDAFRTEHLCHEILRRVLRCEGDVGVSHMGFLIVTSARLGPCSIQQKAQIKTVTNI